MTSHDPHVVSPKSQTNFIIIIAVTAALGGFLFGFDTALTR